MNRGDMASRNVQRCLRQEEPESEEWWKAQQEGQSRQARKQGENQLSFVLRRVTSVCPVSPACPPPMELQTGRPSSPPTVPRTGSRQPIPENHQKPQTTLVN